MSRLALLAFIGIELHTHIFSIDCDGNCFFYSFHLFTSGPSFCHHCIVCFEVLICSVFAGLVLVLEMPLVTRFCPTRGAVYTLFVMISYCRTVDPLSHSLKATCLEPFSILGTRSCILLIF